jgi:hypothetical protein
MHKEVFPTRQARFGKVLLLLALCFLLAVFCRLWFSGLDSLIVRPTDEGEPYPSRTEAGAAALARTGGGPLPRCERERADGGDAR